MTTAPDVRTALESARRELLDLTARNRLLNAPRRTRSRTVVVVGEGADDLFRILVEERRPMRFLPAPEPASGGEERGEETPAPPSADPEAAEAAEAALRAGVSWLAAAERAPVEEEPDEEGPFGGLAPPAEDETVGDDLIEADLDAAPGAATPGSESEDAAALRARRLDRKLLTDLSPEALQRRLLSIFYDARTFLEEQGTSSLYLALGFLRWVERDASARERWAPLVLVPVTLERRSVRARFELSWSEEELETNLSLQEKLRADFGLSLPDLPDEVTPSEYAAAVAEAVAGQPGWEVRPDEVRLGFFSFSKLLMYRDLDPAAWPGERALEAHAVVGGLLGPGLAPTPPLAGEDDPVDPVVDTRDLVHVRDADSSQTLVIEEVRRGRSLVIQGPPGTGKSQTITNCIAAAVRDKQRVLFVAEKMAALEVVKRRLDELDLGDLVLELHSHKASKRRVLEDLGETLELGRPACGDVEATADRLRVVRDELNAAANVLHAPWGASGVTAHGAMGELIRLRSEGVPPPDFGLELAPEWDAEGRHERARLVEELAAQTERLGTPAASPWRGACVEVLLPADRDRLVPEIERLRAAVGDLRGARDGLAAALGGAPDTQPAALGGVPDPTAVEVRGGCAVAALVERAPDLDRDAVGHEAWRTRRPALGELVSAGERWSAARTALGAVLVEAAWTADVAQARRDLAARGRSLLRFLSGAYRRAVRELRGVCAAEPPKGLDARLSILDRLMNAQAARRAVEQGDPLGRSAFGDRWSGPESDFAGLRALFDWVGEADSAGHLEPALAAAAREVDRARLAEARLAAEQAVAPAIAAMGAVFHPLDLDPEQAFDAVDPAHVPLDELAARTAAWLGDPEGLHRWIAFRARWVRAISAGLTEVASRVHDGSLAPADAPAAFRHAYFESVLRALWKQHPALARFEGLAHEARAAEFRRHDELRMELARAEVALAHWEGLPRGEAEIGELGLLRREVKKKRRHLPMRRLLGEAGRCVQAVKPVFMMSPLSVARFLEPGGIEFDLLLIDEASQVRPVDALGAIARAKQVVVVGDEKQLPPTSFFDKALDEDRWGDDEAPTGDLESVLGLCLAQGLPQRLLRWHYRSRHQSLIAVSNREFYGDRLRVVPSPVRAGRGLGVRLRHVTEGVYDRGGTSTNPAEARAVAEAALAHAREHPHLSLGVGTFSVSQRDAILDELERLWRDASDVREFFAPGGAEPFFVKNLENVQGDERDVIFVSVGYARDADGRLSMNFGPLSAEGGERRLNVLITRAKVRCEVFTSILAGDLDLSRASGRGPAALATYLRYAETGTLDGSVAAAGVPGSLLAEEAARALREDGHAVDAAVGLGGFRVDLAVRDPDDDGAYVLGIETDSPAWQAARTARDRERTQPGVLRSKGWTLHRVWSADWFQRPAEEQARLLAAVETATEARRALAAASAPVPPTVRSDDGPEPLERKDLSPDEEAGIAVPYEEARFRVRSRVEPHEARIDTLRSAVVRIVTTEGPVHADEIGRRLAACWGLTRAGQRVQEATARGLEAAVASGEVDVDGEFFDVPVRDGGVRVRDRARVGSATLRKPEMLPPSEVRTAVHALVAAHMGCSPDDTVRETRRLLGFQSTSARLRALVEDAIETLVAAGQLARDGEALRVTEAPQEPGA